MSPPKQSPERLPVRAAAVFRHLAKARCLNTLRLYRFQSPLATVFAAQTTRRYQKLVLIFPAHLF